MMPKLPGIPIFLTIFTLCAHLAASAQHEPVIILRGIIKDAATGEPMKPGPTPDRQRPSEHQVRENANDKDSFWENYNAMEANFNVDSALAGSRTNNSKAQRK